MRLRPSALPWLGCLVLAASCTPGGVVRPADAGGRDAGGGVDAGEVEEEDAGSEEEDAGTLDDAGALDCTASGACAQGACAGMVCDGNGGRCQAGTCVPTTPETETVCDDSIDEDEDGLTDCMDPDCACGPQVEIGDIQLVRSFGRSTTLMGEGACPPGQVVVGFAGASGLFIDRIQPICAALYTEDFLTDVIQIRTGPATVVATPGGPGGVDFEDRCPDDMIVTRINVQSQTWIGSITARCEALFASRNGSDWNIYGDGQAMLPVRGSGPGAAEESSCVDGGFTRLEVQYAMYVSRLTAECRDFAIVEP